jgi:hypothetical protein
MTTTTYEPHYVTCLKCVVPIESCEEFNCVNRYPHSNGLCENCEAEETGKEWGEE